ncbi:uncharacterized protein LOC127849631 [Dreissena polymorpha]|nr:uncharacterized protein LOC127849631 [Dreissena polymorpha]
MAIVTVILIVSCFSACFAKDGDSNVGPGEINAALENLEMHYSDHLCHDIRDLNCARHQVMHDEQICGTDGITYSDHCHFAKERCRHILRQLTPVNVAFHGACNTDAVHSTVTLEVTTTHTQTHASVQQISTPSTNVASTSAAVTSLTTTLTLNQIFANAFCQQASYVTCSSDLEVQCGSDGQLYPNRCELAKAKCTMPTLDVVDISRCL